MNYSDYVYIAACVFTQHYPELSLRIQAYLTERFGMPIVRCCALAYKVRQYEEAVPEEWREQWKKIPHSRRFYPGDKVVSICHNCTAVIEEPQPEVSLMSLWELILEDKQFKYPNYHGERMTLQDCWRTRGHHEEHEAVRELLRRMNIDYIELDGCRDQTTFCGNSLYRPAPPRNLKMAPHRFVENAQGLFEPHTLEEQKKIMEQYCQRFTTEKVVTYCHYCSEGIKLGGKTEEHLASLLFGGGYHWM